MKILLAHNYTDKIHENQNSFAFALRRLGHTVDQHPIMSSRIPLDGYDLGIQLDCCEDASFHWDIKYPDIYYAFDNWQNYNNMRQPGFRGDGDFCRKEFYIVRARVAHVNFCISRIGVENLMVYKIKSHWLPIGADERLIREPRRSGFRFDVASACNFGGMSHLPNMRKHYANVLKEKYNASVGAGCPYWQIPERYNNSVAVFNYSPSGFIVSSLALMGYNDGEHYVSYKDEEDLIDKLTFLKKNLDYRNSVAEKGHELTVSKWLMRHNMQRMLETARKENVL